MLNLFGGKKKNGYYLELDESQSSEPEAAPVAETVVAPVKEEKPATVTVAPISAQEPKPEPVAAKSGKKGKAKKSVKATSVKSVAIQWEPPEWVKAIKNYSDNSQVKEELSEGLFASKYLMPTPINSRRVPGPSMNKFRDMARKTGGRG